MSKIPLKVTLRRKRLSKVLSRASSSEFLTMIWAANSLVQQRKNAGLRYLRVPSETVDEITQNRGPIFGWHLESLTNEGLIHSSSKPASGRRLHCGSWAGFTEVYNALHELSDAESVVDLIEDNIVSAVPRILWNQMQWGVGFPTAQYFYRYWYLYNSADADAVMRTKYGIGLEAFCLAGFSAFSQSLRQPWVKPKPMPVFGLKSEELQAFLTAVAKPNSFMRSYTRKIRYPKSKPHHTPVDFRKSALRDYPIIARKTLYGTYYCSPIPELICARIGEGLFFDLKGDGGLGNDYGRRFEHYVSDLVSFRLSSACSIDPEYEYRKGMKSPDVLVAEDEWRLKLIIECKTLNLGVPIRQSPDPWQTHRDYFDDIIKGVVQIWRYCAFIQSSGQDKYSTDLSLARGLLMTLHPWFIVDLEKRDAVMAAAEAKADEKGISASARIPIGFMHAEDLERTVSLLDANDFFHAVDEICLTEYRDYKTRQTWQSLYSKDREASGIAQFPFGQKLGEVMPWWKQVRE
ncbi:hypothetical protein K3X44_09870 [Aliiroseovarius crassostreae]|uniref:hypothetical protein n=1 Tax=Aliiroseovarius crassostreae TaxID=154981 RepID=UPI002207326E|nr:hypothetical protein [Aliiroseovarius crassostreae]UWQ00823.1 hypothetical protein K3X44_09870 [Aliiroseovarius crassostreae]